MKPNNIDAALTPSAEPVEWDDHTESSEPTEASKLLRGNRPDELFAAAHEAGRELRRSRRDGQDAVSSPEPRDWSKVEATDDFDFDGVVERIRNSEPTNYYDFLEVLKLLTKGLRKSPPTVDSDEWREIPGFPNYTMHARTRRVWRQGYERTLPSGAVRKYAAKEVTARNGTLTLSVDGVVTSRGVNVLYRETFPEAGKKPKKRELGEWDDTVVPRPTPYPGVSEWMSDGGVGVVSRPK